MTIRLVQRVGTAELYFTDTGCGMTQEVLDNIFEPFFTHSRTGKGTGLGLTISHSIISQHGGEIEASSPGPKQGSTFVVRLPLQAAEETVRRRRWRRENAYAPSPQSGEREGSARSYASPALEAVETRGPRQVTPRQDASAAPIREWWP